MAIWSFYDATTGQFLNRQVECDADHLAVNTPSGAAAIEGEYDPLSQKVDIATGDVVDHVPPKPADTEDLRQERDESTKRWVGRPTLAAHKKARKEPIRAQIDALESTQHAPMRAIALKLAAGKAAPPAAVAKVQAVDDAITPLQATLAAITACTTQAELDAITPLQATLAAITACTTQAELDAITP